MEWTNVPSIIPYEGVAPVPVPSFMGITGPPPALPELSAAWITEADTRKKTKNDLDIRGIYPCNCALGGTCHRKDHKDGEPCGKSVTITKNSRHKVCNQCRKAKKPKSGVAAGLALVPEERPAKAQRISNATDEAEAEARKASSSDGLVNISPELAIALVSDIPPYEVSIPPVPPSMVPIPTMVPASPSFNERG